MAVQRVVVTVQQPPPRAPNNEPRLPRKQPRGLQRERAQIIPIHRLVEGVDVPVRRLVEHSFAPDGSQHAEGRIGTQRVRIVGDADGARDLEIADVGRLVVVGYGVWNLLASGRVAEDPGVVCWRAPVEPDGRTGTGVAVVVLRLLGLVI